MQKTNHTIYISLLVGAILVTACSAWFSSTSIWFTIVVSIGCGGVSSVLTAWVIDWRNYHASQKENSIKYKRILRRYVSLYLRLLWNTSNESYGLTDTSVERSFKEWLDLVGNEKNYQYVDSHGTIKRRCERIAGCVQQLNDFLVEFSSQSATLIMSDFPKIEKILDFFEVQQTHCWGTLKQLEIGEYKFFCETTFILFREFLDFFPEYKPLFPEKYSRYTLPQKIIYKKSLLS